MSKSLRTKIEWAHFTLNFWWGCTKVSEACRYCYAEMLSRIFSKGQASWGPAGARWLRFDSAAAKTLKIVRAGEREKFRPRVFVNSMSDSFEENPALDTIRERMLRLLEATAGCDFLLLTKRPENVRRMVPQAWLENWPAHIWVGTTVEDQASADVRIPHLVQIPARRRFLSCEPLLGPIDLGLLGTASKELGVGYVPFYCLIHWVIVGGESGAKARPSAPSWLLSLRDQCVEANVLFFFKQWGEWGPRNMYLNGALLTRDGKKNTGRVLDGREWNDVPTSAV